MSSVDNRIVRMEFQNSDFEKNIQTSEESLKKFNKTLSSFGDDGVSSTLDKIAGKFSTLGIIGVTALQNITNQAIDLGEHLIKSLTVDNIASGWSKLENQTKAVGTLVSQGFDINEVNKQLEQLQWYTDETSYNFNDMLTAVSKFTAQGQTLSDSVSALEGIANWAAIAGQNATAGSSAMRELSQAAGVGYVRYQDWSSIQTLMMDYDGLRDMILETAVSMGTLKQNADGTYQSLVALTDQGATAFSKSQMATYLTTGRWLTTDVLMKVLNQFSEAVQPVYDYVKENNVTAAEAIEALNGQISDTALGFFRAAQEARTLGDALDSVKEGVASGWQTTFGILVGDYEKQRALWTDLADRLYEVFVEGGNARNELLQSWADLGGREKLIQGIWNIFDAGVKIVNTIKQAFKNIFPSKTAEELLNLTEKFEAFTEKLIISDETADKIGRTFQGVFSILKLGRDIIYALIKPIASLMGSSNGLADAILTVTANIGDSISNFVHMIEEGDKLKVVTEAVTKVFKVLGGIISIVGGAIGALIDKTKDLTKSFTNPLKKVENKFDAVTQAVKGFKAGLSSLKGSKEGIVEIQLASEGLSAAFEEESIIDAPTKLGKISRTFSELGVNVKSKYEAYIKPAFDGIIGFFKDNIFNSGVVSGIIKILAAIAAFRFTWGLADLITAIPSAIANIIKSLGSLSAILNGLALNLKGSGYLKYAAAIGIVVASLWALTKIDTDSIWNALKVVSEVMDELNEITLKSIVTLWALSKIDLTPFIIGIGVFAVAIYALSKLVPLLDSFGLGIKDAFSEENLDKISSFIHKIIDVIGSISGIQFTFAFAGLFKALTSFVKKAANFKLISIQVFNKDTSWAAKMLKFAGAIAIVSLSIIALGKMNPSELLQGVQIVGLVAGLMSTLTIILTGFTYLTKTTDKVGSIGKSILELAIGIGIISVAMKLLSTLSSEDVDTCLTALTGIAAIFVGLTVATNLINSGTSAGQIKAVGIAMIEMAVSMIILGGALKIMATLNLEEMASSLLGVIGALATMTFALVAVSSVLDGRSALNIIGIAVAFDLLAGAMIVISVAILSLSNLPWEETISGAGALGIALLSMAGSLAIVGKLVGFWSSIGAVVALAGMAGVIFLVAKAFQEFATIESDKLWTIVGAIAAVVGVMGLAVGVLTAVAGAFPIGGAIVLGVLALLAAGFVAAGWAISQIVESFESLAVTIADRGPDIAEGISLIAKSVADGILNISKSIAEGIATIAAWPALAVSKAIEGIGGAVSKIWNAIKPASNSIGEYMIEGFSLGMNNTKSESKLKTAAKGILSTIRKVLGINSPSTEAADDGYWWNAGFANSMVDNFALIGDAASTNLTSLNSIFSDGGANAVSMFNTSVADGVDMSMFEGVMSDYMSNSGAERLKESSSIMGVSLSTDVANAMADTMGTGLKDVDTSSASFLDSLIGNSKSNWAAELWGNSLAESVSAPYADKMVQAMAAVDEYVAEKTVATSNAMGALLGVAVGLDALGIEDKEYIMEKASISAEKSIKKTESAAKSAYRAIGREALGTGIFDPLGTGVTTEALKKVAELRDGTTGILNNISKTNLNMLSDSNKAAETLRRKISEIFTTAKNDDITPTVDYEEMTTNIQNALDSTDYSINVKANIDPESEKTLEDWELSTEELIRKYATLSKSYYDGEWHDMWAYNGPRSGLVMDDGEYEVEWVYEGPMGGDYDATLDKYYANVNGKLYDISEWTQELTDAYHGHTDEMVDTISQNTAEITNALQNQTDQESKYSDDILSSISGLSTKLDGIDTGIDDLGTGISNLKLYLDGDALVGGLTDRIDSSLGTTQKYKTQGVLR